MSIKSRSIIILFFLQFGIFSQVASAQSTNYYQEVKSKVMFPQGFDKSKSEEIISTIAIERLRLVKEAKIVNNKNLEDYLNSIAKKLLQNDAKLTQNISVWCVKDLSANALSYIDGSIYINQGLIIHLQCEAELAFIIAHEIAHISKKHALKEIELRDKVLQAEINTDNNLAKSYRSLIHSKENEYEADGVALKMVIQAGYDPNKAIGVLNILSSDSSMFQRIDVAKLLSIEIDNSLAKLDSTEWVRSNKRNEKTILEIKESASDQFSTHPEIAKRIISLYEQLKIYDSPNGNALFLLKDSALFKQTQHILSQHALNTAIDNFDYQTAIIMALSNKFAFDKDQRDISLLKSLYFISQSKENKYDEELLKKSSILVDSNMVDLNKILYSYDNDKFKKLIYGYSKKLVDVNPNEENYFYYALCNETYLGKQTSQIIFQNMLNRFPNGKYTLVAKQKLTPNEIK
jgi:Zn-dependent protease with chaperone function